MPTRLNDRYIIGAIVAYLGHGIFHPVAVLFFFSKSVFGRGLQLPKSSTSEKKRSTCIVARVDMDCSFHDIVV